jgi:NAD(P)-dependent dehydrogenase (short-subunit alcohol dehydrogenase family)
MVLREESARMDDVGSGLRGRVVMVTGGASGLGAAVCRTLAESGATVVVTDVDEERALMAADALSADGGSATARVLDVRDEHQARSAIAAAVSEQGRLDAIVNNAGVDVTKSAIEMSFEEWDRVIDVNLRGPFVLSKLAFEHMRRQGRGGHIVNIVSTAARRAWANAAAYHASKWGLLGLSHALHVEGREHHIKVTALIAGGMKTPFLLDRFPDIDQSLLQDPESVAQAVRFVLTQPRGTVIPELMVLPERESSWP